MQGPLAAVCPPTPDLGGGVSAKSVKSKKSVKSVNSVNFWPKSIGFISKSLILVSKIKENLRNTNEFH